MRYTPGVVAPCSLPQQNLQARAAQVLRPCREEGVGVLFEVVAASQGCGGGADRRCQFNCLDLPVQ